ncbi:MAG: hypothetical protein GKR94_10470 [Gammaproteobacteria bacterium]|nr:hypothetical protein [Gammaproteobacteria bacterium]
MVKDVASAEDVADGTVAQFGDKRCVYYDGYWIRHYTPPPDDLHARKVLIDSLTRRLFHHTEPGINTPGDRLDRAREAFQKEIEPSRRRVNAAMLAGALFNRATDIFTAIVELGEHGVEISSDNELMLKCERYFQEALELGKQVKHYSGHEGIDELWGEPFKAFALPIPVFYESRYLKIAQSMRDIDAIASVMCDVIGAVSGFADSVPLIHAFQEQAKLESETMRSDPKIFEVWPSYVAAGEALLSYAPTGPRNDALHREVGALLKDGKALIGYIAGARVPMPKSSRQYMDACMVFEGTRRPMLHAAV